MFNVTIIKLRDVFKIIFILIIIYLLSKFIFKNVSIKKNINISTITSSNEFLTSGINNESNIIKNISKENVVKDEQTEDIEENETDLLLKNILKVGSNIFNVKELEIDIGQDDSVKQEENIVQPVQEEINPSNTEVITQNPLPENYNKEYEGIKIKNETSYELTDDMLNSDALNINSNNIIIFHTHTCESYTQSEKYTYEPSRKL